MIITLQARNTITIPRELRQALELEPGAPMDARVEKGHLVLTPLAVVPRTLHLTADGEAKEAEAEEDIRQGRVFRFEDASELLEDLAGKTSEEWPESITKLAGAWPDFPTREEIHASAGEDLPREDL